VLYFSWKKNADSIWQVFVIKSVPDGLLILFACFISSIWCWDLLQPIQLGSEFISLNAWGDIFNHMSQINVFSRATNLHFEADILSSEIPFRLYHYASYLLPSLISKVANFTSYAVYAGFLVPMGLMLLCFATYLLASLLFGQWAGLFASFMLLLLPDPFHQGFGNLFLGQFHWLIQASPAMPYGIACAAIAFACIFQFYKSQQLKLIFVAYLFVIFALLYKSQIFVAISLPALLLPILIYKNIGLISKIFLIGIFLGIYIGTITIANSFPGLPPIRLNGTGFIPYTNWLNDIQSFGIIKDMINNPLVLQHRWVRIPAYIGLLLLTSLGGALIVYTFVLKGISRNLGWFISLFPVFIIIIYILMAFGLALNDSEVGLPEELQHRPFVWAYTVVSIWAYAGVYLLCFGRQPPKNYITRVFLIILGGALFIFPFKNYKDIQGHIQTSKLVIPICEFKSAIFIEENAPHGAVFQESGADSLMVMSAFSRKQEFAVNFLGSKIPKAIQYRLAELNSAKQIADPQLVNKYMLAHQIRYFIVNPKENLPWEGALNSKLVYECGGYRIFEFI